MITVLSGGVGAARFLRGLIEICPPSRCTALVNVGDDLALHGLHISPDVDTVIYTLADRIDRDRGWGLAEESWRVLEELGHLGGQTWFNLGDRDIARHLFRTQRLADGAPLSAVTRELAAAHDVTVRVLPVTDDPLRTKVTVANLGEIDFQQYFVRHQHRLEVRDIRFAGAGDARAAPGVLDAIDDADVVVIAPSNPLVSIGPVLAVDGIAAAVRAAREHVVAVSPIVGGRTIKGPAADMMRALGHEPTVVGVARMYAPLAGCLVIDETDADLAAEVEACGMDVHVTDTIMSDVDRAANLASEVVATTGLTVEDLRP